MKNGTQIVPAGGLRQYDEWVEHENRPADPTVRDLTKILKANNNNKKFAFSAPTYYFINLNLAS